MEIKTQPTEISTIGHLPTQQFKTFVERDQSKDPVGTKGDSDLGEYGRVVLIRGSGTQKTITVPLAPQREERRYKTLVENRGPIEVDSTGSE